MMVITYLRTTGSGAVAAALLLAGCSAAPCPPPVAAPVAAAAPAAPAPVAAAPDPIVARVAGQPVTEKELDAALGTARLRFRQQEYDERIKALNGLAVERLEKAEAAKRGIPVEELRRIEITEKAAKPSEDDISTMLKFLKSRLPKDPAQARAAVVDALARQKEGEREAEFHQELQRGGKVEILMTPPRFPVAIDALEPVRGAVSSPVTFVEYSDFQCPYCGRSQELVKKLFAQYGDRVRFVFHNRPLYIHERARFAAEAGLCASEQGKFWELHDWMFQNPNELQLDKMKGAAQSMGVDVAAFEACVAAKKYAPVVEREIAQAESMGVDGTPTFFVNGRMMSLGNSLEEFQQVIDQELAPPSAEPAMR